MGKKKEFLTREEQEATEGYKTQSVDVPGSRFQTEQQNVPAASGSKTKVESTGFGKKKTKAEGSVLKQEVAARVVDTGVGGEVPEAAAAVRGLSYSGNEGTILASAAYTPIAGQSRSDSRTGKKLDATAKKINFVPSEQVEEVFDESKPLAANPSAVQGYNGSPRNVNARSQKNVGFAPSELLFQRSLDELKRDQLYFSTGQVVKEMIGNTAIDLADTPTIVPERNPSTGVYVYGNTDNYSLVRGNYLHRTMTIRFNSEGKLTKMIFDTVDVTAKSGDVTVINDASANATIDMNYAEMDRQNMDHKAGDEKAEIWTPLARAIANPTGASYLMSSIEADTGAYAHLAYSKASTNMAHQLNRAAKDGLDIITPALEQMSGWRYPDSKSKSMYNRYFGSVGNAFTTDNYRAGDPSLMIAAYDSINKYNNKADFILQPRGYRMHLQTADNNINPLKCPREYAQVFAGQETYSTIDHEYDGLTPLNITDKANLILVHDLNELAGFININKVETVLTSTDIKAAYGYENKLLIPKGILTYLDYDNIYVYSKKTNSDGLVYSNGVIAWQADNGNGEKKNEIILRTTALSADDLAEGGDYYGFSLLTTYTKANNVSYDLVYHAPIVQNVTSGTVISAAVTTKIFEFKIEHQYAGQYNYMYSDLRNNYIVEVKHPLVEGIIQYINEGIGGKFRNLLKQELLTIPFIFSTQHMTLAQLIICAATPWITRVRQNSMKDVIYYEDNIHEYPYSKLASIKELPFKNYVNFNFSSYDEPIESKVMNPVVAMQWEMPEFFWKVGDGQYVAPWYFNENELNTDGTVDEDASAMSFPSIRSGIRLGYLDNFYGMSEKDVRLSLDRMTKALLNNSTKFNGFKAYKYARNVDGQILCIMNSEQDITVNDILSSPRELGLCMDAPLGILTKDPADSGAYKALTANGISTSHRIKIYVNPETPEHPAELSSTGVNITRGANYTQMWYELCANNATSNTDIAGLVFGINDEDTGLFSPFADLGTGEQMSSGPSIKSYQRSIWTRLQLLPYILSPFDANFNSNNTYSHDIFDFAYFFGLAGFRASDYRESVYNREKEVINQGLLFVEDPWIIDSPIMKNGASSIGVSLTKGYELNKK